MSSSGSTPCTALAKESGERMSPMRRSTDWVTPADSKMDGPGGGGSATPVTCAPSRSSHSDSQPPLKPVWPVTSTRLPAKALTKSSSEEHTSELQSLMRISYAVFFLQKKKNQITYHLTHNRTTINTVLI